MTKDFKNLKCNSCSTIFRIVAKLHDIEYAMCPRCGGVNLDYPKRKEERKFEKQIS